MPATYRFGRDASTMVGTNHDQVDLTGRYLTEEDLLLENAYRKLTTPAGALFWAPNNTTDVRELVKKGTTSEDRSAYAKFIESLFRNDARCFARCTMDLVDGNILLDLALTSRKDGQTYVANFLVTPYEVKILTAADPLVS